ncbi:gamma-glutamyltransferase [Salisediminibacterium halotolerans]|uniref:Gamma-glutamyltranspeptidase / glutathione hydrolase n=1 Tax=Salisediminibacterium halotolerans TaxID=517425 RepID=A0A1H9SKR0_9BACI|nr:gamma-glutamyltransferase [Salisediminibacterium haloalkalitolerans]SER84933.1 gamma-glutamyltranspeptidase / glutathione hydrolase [Salisediminibacterium haloalkalitolerans]
MNHYKKDLKWTYILSVITFAGLIFWNLQGQQALFGDAYSGDDYREREHEAIEIADHDGRNASEDDTEDQRVSEDASSQEINEPGVYGVSSAHPLAVEAGMDILEGADGKEPGNAVDAAVAISFTLGVVEPYGSGLGGGGNMLIHDPDEGIVNYDYREAAPESAETLDQVPEQGMAIPGFVKGMEAVYHEMGSGDRDWEDLIDPAIAHAEEGYQVDQVFSEQLSSFYPNLNFDFSGNGGRTDESEYLPVANNPVEDGDTIQPEELKETLNLLQDGGADEFYQGELSESLAETMAANSNELTADDLADDLDRYEVQRTEGNEVASGTWRSQEQTIYGSPSPASSTIVIQALKMASQIELTNLIDTIENGNESHGIAIDDVTEILADELNIDGFDKDNVELGHLAHSEETEAHYYHLMNEITEAVYNDRLGTLGDPQFDDINHEELTSDAYIEELLEDVEWDPFAIYEEDRDELDQNEPVEEEPDTTAAVHDAVETDLDDPGNTTHFVVVDQEGRMVSVTHSLGEFFGSGIYNDGYFLNNQTDNFSENEESMNRYEPGKRPRTFVSPIIFAEEGRNGQERPVLGLGTPGGSRIPAMLFQTAMQYQYGLNDEGEPLTLQEAIMEPRFYKDGQSMFTEEYLDNDYARAILQYNPIDNPENYPNTDPLNLDDDDNAKQMGYGVNLRGFDDNPLFYGGIQGLGLRTDDSGNINGIYGGGDERRSGSWAIDQEEAEDE